ncbi:MetS family NSS transporter small subunit [Gordonia alkaliphila]|uniref:Methionine/alanine importer small subunit n=1 Tax=Gordonia alkaliphila TaxID=1053547 RepID=A0ABP8ZDD1_9ACTN|nr:MetS family NSS transporter small subunit [Gordonia alkaliphila]MCK0438316.1 MetS family NSS transporter small subunit [Gordonia alkaliphila]
MTGPAITLLIVAILLVWGGLIGSISYLRARAEVDPSTLPPLPDDVVDEARQQQEAHPTRDT